MVDIVVIGSGPAGANFARLMGDRYKVLLLDRRDLENKEPKNKATKCCGGLLAPDAQKMIAMLGLGIPKDILVDPQLFAVRAIDLTNNLEKMYQRFYYNMDREKFDRWLVSLIPTGVEKSFNSVFKTFSRISGGYEVSYMHSGQEISVKAKVIVGADGAFSRVRKLAGRDVASPEKYIAIQEWFGCQNQIPYYTAIFDEEISDYYSWIIPKDSSILLGSALRPGENAWRKYGLLKEKLSKSGFHFDKKLKTEGSYIFRPKKASQFYTGRDGIAFIGEAAGAVSPSSAEGISYALKSSLYLAESLKDGMDGFLDRYERKTKSIKLNLLLKNLKSPAMYDPFLRKLVMGSGLLSMK